MEEVLWKALNKARFILPTADPSKSSDDVNWEGCEYSKCGRTDRGVSAFGQVIGLRVRSNRPLQKVKSEQIGVDTSDTESGSLQRATNIRTSTPSLDAKLEGVNTPCPPLDSFSSETPSFDPINDEIPYPQVLNGLLPPDIRILAWCPSPPEEFSARFSCKERRYKYFFTQPAFTPSIGEQGFASTSRASKYSHVRRREGWLDIEAMRAGAKKFEGLHDFRNFCKVDPSKQTENFKRRMSHADIEELDTQKSPMGYVGSPGFREYEDGENATLSNDMSIVTTETPRVYAFTLHGTAFLWHQVRHMVAILFLIGQGLESPSLIDELLDVSKNPQKPQYEMADDAALVLWDCIFPAQDGDLRTDALEWVYVGDFTGHERGIISAGGVKGDGKYGLGGLMAEMWKVWRQHKMQEVLAGTLLDVIMERGKEKGSKGHETSFRGSQKLFAGGNGPRLVGKYVPVMEKPKMETVESINARYIARKSQGSHKRAMCQTDPREQSVRSSYTAGII